MKRRWFMLAGGRRRRVVGLLPLTLLGVLILATGPVLGAQQEINSAGPLDEIIITDELNCQVGHTSDTSFEFFGGEIGACATLVAVGGTLYGPSGIPAGGSASPRTPYTLVSQSAVTGSGTLADPFRVVTVVDAGTSLRITETDSYVVGQESYRTEVQVANLTGEPLSVIIYRAGDCFLQDSDDGFGAVNPATGAVSCVAPADPANPAAGPGERIEQWFPLTPGSSHYEANFSEVWAHIGGQTAFPNTCECAEFQDNGAGLSWSLTIPGGGSVAVSHITTFSPLGVDPLTTTKTADAASSAPGAANGYTITISNPNAGAIVLSTITDTLPEGFGYTAGSTTGATTANPAISGQNLTWNGPFSVPAGGNVSLHFGVTVSTTPGTYTNQAGGTAEGATVTPTGPTAPVTVTGAAAAATPTPTPTPTPAPAARTIPNTFTGQSGSTGAAGVALLVLLLGGSVTAMAAINVRSARARHP